MLKKVISALFLMFLQYGTASAQLLNAQVDNLRPSLGEVFNLNISYSGADGGSVQPDLSVLQNDFSVYSTSSSMQTSYMNGKMSQIRDWDIGLMSKHEGTIVIPPISVGKNQTKPIEIAVQPAGSAAATVHGQQGNEQTDNHQAQAARFSAELQIDNKNPYVQQQINAVLTIEDSVGLQFASEPVFLNADNWVIKQLGKPTVTMKNNGMREIKFSYALFAQKSGILEVPSVQTDAFYLSFDDSQFPRQTRGFFQFFDMDIDSLFGVKKPVRLLSKPMEISVRPAPEDYDSAWWLPAQALAMTARWVDEHPVFAVGETVAREITLTAAGITEAQLPDISFPESSAVKQYPEKPQYVSSVSNDSIISQEVIRVVYIPQKGGDVELPEIRLPWFNVLTQKIETAVIPAEKIRVSGESIVDTEVQAEPQTMKPEDEIADEQPLSEQKNEPNLWIVAGIVAGFAFLAGIFLSFFIFRQVKKADEVKSASAWVSLIQKNLSHHDYRALRDNLLRWGNEVFSDRSINNLNDLSEAVNQDEFSHQLHLINSILYADAKVAPDAAVLLNCLKSCKTAKYHKKTVEPLPKLYK